MQIWIPSHACFSLKLIFLLVLIDKYCIFMLLRLCVLIVVSTYTKGSHMVPVLNALNVQCAVYGNHDFGM